MAKFASLEDFFSSLPSDQQIAIKRFVDHVAKNFPELELVLAWNQPMFKSGKKYIIGFMPTKKHINLLTVSDDAINHLSQELEGYRHGTRSISLPFDWEINAELFEKVIDFQLKEPK